MPLMRPVQEYCQNVQPWPCQPCAGIEFGSGVRGQANHSGNPWSANHVEFPSIVWNRYCDPYTIGRTPVRTVTRLSHARAQSSSTPDRIPAGIRFISMSSTGKTSPRPGAATWTKWFASFFASSVDLLGVHTWYAPTGTPASAASAALYAKVGSLYRWLSVAFKIAKRTSSLATRDQLIVSW